MRFTKSLCFSLLCALDLHAAIPLKDVLPANPFFIPAEKVEEILQVTGLSMDELLTQLIPVARNYALPPISHYKVGVAGLGKSGNIYLGVNLEFPDLPLNSAVHGEQFLIAHARNRGEKAIVRMAISAAPCGHCRQFLNEVDADGQLEILTPGLPPKKLSFFLPEAFGPKDLQVVANPWEFSNRSTSSSLIDATLEAATNSYAPYSQSQSAVGIQTSDGHIYTGGYLENAAFNPSLSPLQTALIALVSDFHTYEEIVAVTLVESEGAKISQETATRALLDRIAPQAHFEPIKQ